MARRSGPGFGDGILRELDSPIHVSVPGGDATDIRAAIERYEQAPGLHRIHVAWHVTARGPGDEVYQLRDIPRTAGGRPAIGRLSDWLDAIGWADDDGDGWEIEIDADEYQY